MTGREAPPTPPAPPALPGVLAGVDAAHPPEATLVREAVSSDPLGDGLVLSPPPRGGAVRIGEGGMGVVDAVHDPILGRTVAVKRPRSGARHRAALVSEARTLARLDHPAVVPVHTLGTDTDGTPVLVMKRIQGRPWSEIAGADLERDLQITLRVADALRFAHARGILHRDVKLDNVMVGAFGETYLMDWGCSCPLAGATTTELVGTPAYLAPEMLAIGAPIDVGVDVFLLGATLHHALTGAPRHRGVDVRAVLAEAWRAAPAPPPPGVPPDVHAVVERACARDRAARFATVDAFAAALRDALAHRGTLRLLTRAEEAAARARAAIEADRADADRHVAEARFGFRTALAQWPDCPGAAEGHRALVAAYVPWKLRRGEVEAVEGLLPELEPALAARWSEDVARLRAEKDRREAEWRAGSLAFGGQDRQRLTLGLGVIAFLAFLGVLAVRRTPAAHAPEDLVATGIVALVIPILVVLPLRKRVFTHTLTRGLALSVIAVNAVSLVHRLFAAQAGVDPVETLRADAILVAGITLVGATTAPRLGAVGLPYLAAALATSGFPAYGSVWFPIAALSSVALAVVLLRTGRSSPPPLPSID